MRTPTLVAQLTRFLNPCRPDRVRARADAIRYSACENIGVKAPGLYDAWKGDLFTETRSYDG